LRSCGRSASIGIRLAFPVLDDRAIGARRGNNGGENAMLYLTRNLGPARPYDGIDRMFEEMTRGFGLDAPAAAGVYAPSLEVAETAEAWRVAAELPGVAQADVEVSVTDNVLTIRGEKKRDAAPEGVRLSRDERRFGKFVRSIEFPGDVDAAKVSARVKDGVLVVTLPKAEASKPKTISVKVE
jgi:HSP20 family protein